MTARRVLLAAMIVLLGGAVVGCGPAQEPDPDPIALTATPVPEIQPTPEATPDPSPTPAVSPTPTPDEERDPTDADRARFVADYDPDGVSALRQVAADISGDGVRELVFVGVVDAEQRTRVDIAAWTGSRYEIVARAPGGSADRIESFRVSDITGDGRIEVVVVQSLREDARSASLWQATSEALLEPLVGRGDCFDGSHTYGDTDVRVVASDADRAAQVRAECAEDDVPAELWPTVVYAWEDGAFRCDHRVTADGVRTGCED